MFSDSASRLPDGILTLKLSGITTFWDLVGTIPSDQLWLFSNRQGHY